MKRTRLIFLATAAALAVGSAGFGVATAASPGPTPHRFDPAAARPALAVNPTVNPETYFVSIPACRIVNTHGHGVSFGKNVAHSYFVTGTTGFSGQGGQSGGCGIPSSATAVAARFTTTHPGGSASLAAYPTNQPTGIGTLYYNKNQRSSVSVTQPISTTAVKPLSVKNGNAKGVDLTIDVTGYWVPQIEGYVGGDGTLQVGTSRIVSTSHAGTGFYYITLDRPVRSCSVQATAYNLDHYASVGYSSSATPNTVSVAVWALNAGHTEVLTDFPFHLLVSC